MPAVERVCDGGSGSSRLPRPLSVFLAVSIRIAAKLRWIWTVRLFQEHLESDADESGEALRKTLVAFELPRKPE